MATSTVTYASPVAITMDLANLATSATYVAGRESSEIDNTTNLYLDALVSGFVTVGTTPTANTTIAVYVWGSPVSLATTPIDTLDGTDSAETLTNTGILNALRAGAGVAMPAATTNVQYPVVEFSIARLFGGWMPPYWGLFVAHNTGVNLFNNAANTNSFQYVGIKVTS